jgi:hypothetical protein
MKSDKRKAYERAYRKRNREKITKRTIAWQKANPDKVKAYKQTPEHKAYRNTYAKAWRKANPEKVKAAQHKNRKANPKKAKAQCKSPAFNGFRDEFAKKRYSRAYYEANREKESNRKAKWYLKNRNRLLKKRETYALSIQATKNFFQLNAAVSALKDAAK